MIAHLLCWQSNARRVFKGSELHGSGFLFDDEGAAKGDCESLSDMRDVIASDPKSGERIFPFLTGQDVVSSPTHATNRYAIDLNDLSVQDAEAKYPILFAILARRVLPQRRLDNRASRRTNWWRYGERSSGLYNAIKGKARLLCTTFTSPHMSFCFVGNAFIFANMVIVFPDESTAGFSVLQSRVHEVWARFFASSLKDDLRYTPSDCFRTFPFPKTYDASESLADIGRHYHGYRADLMVAANEGMTKTYNRFHDHDEGGDYRSDLARSARRDGSRRAARLWLGRSRGRIATCLPLRGDRERPHLSRPLLLARGCSATACWHVCWRSTASGMRRRWLRAGCQPLQNRAGETDEGAGPLFDRD